MCKKAHLRKLCDKCLLNNFLRLDGEWMKDKPRPSDNRLVKAQNEKSSDQRRAGRWTDGLCSIL